MSEDIEITFDNILADPVKITLKADLQISEDIDTEVDKASGTFGYYAVMAEKSNTKCAMLELAFEKWEAEITANIDRERELDEAKRLTLPQMQAYMKSLPIYQTFKKRMIDAGEQRGILRAIARAFDLKAQLVQTKAANRRREIK